ncbi:murein hydrolase activator EnvC family protein [Anoxybacillus sp. J5B_2022]|uniref:murein hydrolase activator EnvC family protein n=1 Tax=Anoxybacillus sp. J5B_2022 TaxID=3003246 RepID=UPI002285543C|nr:peptidoglycan DD-metalloendopeptidase family protein [Anoxybacillus sp. J5B_2022]MCZ0754388.1 peptidoglycan DD-metalloendopeptidase family protein [Anoxybacillus sp. J5B_2022]
MSLAVAAVLGVTSFSPYVAAAVSNQEIQQKRNAINSIQSKQSSLQGKMSKADQQIEQLQTQQAQLAEEMKKLDMAVSETSEKIGNLSQTIDDTKQDIQVLKKEIAEVQARIEKRNELLKERVRSLQQSGGVISYLDVLLGSQSFGDFIDRISAVTTIFEADKQIIQEQEEDKALKEKKENELTSKLTTLQNDLQELEQLKQTLNRQMDEKEQLIAQLKQQEQHISEEKLALAEEQELLEKQEAAIRAQLQQLLAQKQRESAGQRSSSASNHSSGNVPQVTDGAFMRPANGPITSGFGPRGGEFHYGVDIGKRAAEVPVVAAADGYVFRSYYSSSYGNVVFITHVIDGQVYTTVYAHLESRLVSEGQTVSKGQIIGYMGNTGQSEGSHLHFELHRGPWNAAKSNAVNPLSYINF